MSIFRTSRETDELADDVAALEKRVAALEAKPDVSAGLISAAKHLTASADQIKKQAETLLDIGTDECREQAAELAIIEPCLRAEANYLRDRATKGGGK